VIEFGPWLPDLPDFENPGLVTAKNVVYYGAAYHPKGALNSVLAALPAQCTGFVSLINQGAVVQIFAGTTTDLYELVSGAWVNRGSGYINAQWRFAQFGNTLLAVTPNTQVQYVTLGGSHNFAGVSGLYYSELIAVIRDFVVLANVYDTTGTQPQKVIWSQINNPIEFAYSAAQQSDAQILNGSWGPITGIVGGDYGVVFQQSAIWRMDYVGSPTVFSFTLQEKGRGTQIPGSVIDAGNIPGGGRRIFYIGVDGLYAFDGQTSTPIGVNKVNNWLATDLDLNYAANVRGVADTKNETVMWLYPGSGNTAGLPNKILAYNYVQDRFTVLEVTAEMIGLFMNPSSSLDSNVFNMDTTIVSMDAQNLVGSTPLIGAVNSSHEMCQFIGSNLAATIETGEMQVESGKSKDYMRLMTQQAQIIPGNRSMVTAVRAYTDSSPTVSIGTRNLPTDSVTYIAAGSQNSYGLYPVRANARYIRGKFAWASGDSWSYVQGWRMQATKTSRR
jgi:hypothetical protein